LKTLMCDLSPSYPVRREGANNGDSQQGNPLS
jgi:hypothetical protein